jgi:hypothetical protein
MKKTMLIKFPSFFAIICFSIGLFAQNNQGKLDDIARIGITSYIPEQIENLPLGSENLLFNKLEQITSENGLGSFSFKNRFIITPAVNIVNKDIINSAPPMTALNIQITYYIGDGIEGVKFGNYQQTIKGVGINENKAFIDAIKKINPKDNGVQDFLEKSKNKIIQYYNTRCDFIIKQSELLASQNKFEEAIFNLVSVPEVCLDCYDKSLKAVGPLFKMKIDRDCLIKMNEAEAIWSANQTFEIANEIAIILSSIDPDAKCYPQAKSLYSKVAKRVIEIDKREWNFVMETEVNLERDRIKAIRDIGVAFGNGQPQSMVYNIIGWTR